MRVCLASGKGGTGKTLLATNLADHLARHFKGVNYLDADVEEPNGFLFLKPEVDGVVRVAVSVPTLKNESCSACGVCADFCAFNALVAVDKGILVFNELCHSCGGCQLVCPEKALTERLREVGTLRRGRRDKLSCSDGRLDVGEPRAVPVIESLLERSGDDKLTIIDAPPGTACNATAVVGRCDFVILVTEPTPFGLHDLRLAVEMCRLLEKPAVAVINRSDLGDDAVRRYLSESGVRIIAELPFERGIADAYAAGELAAAHSEALHRVIETLAREVLRAV